MFRLVRSDQRWFAFANFAIDRRIDIRIADDTTGHTAITHDFRTLPAGDTALRAIHSAMRDDVRSEIGIGEGLTAESGDIEPARGDTPGGDIRAEFPKP